MFPVSEFLVSTQLFSHEFKLNHEEWIQKTIESSTSGVSEHIKEALETESELVSECLKLRNEARLAMNELLMVYSIPNFNIFGLRPLYVLR